MKVADEEEGIYVKQMRMRRMRGNETQWRWKMRVREANEIEDEAGGESKKKGG